MNFFKATDMQAVDRETISSGVSGEGLMARASQKLAAELVFFSEGRSRPVVILCGPGNNGGDGFGMAAHLQRLGWQVEVWVCTPEEKIKGDALLFYQQAKAQGVVCRSMQTRENWNQVEHFLSPGSWLVDALLGTGGEDAPRGNIASAIQFLRKQQSRHFIWSVDVPSGLQADTGLPFVEECCVSADQTLTLGGPKTGFASDKSNFWTGSISVLDLGFDAQVLAAHADRDCPQALSDREAAALFPLSTRNAHKGSRGHLLLVGGSLGMTGAISLSAWAALRGGCGLVTVLTPFSCAQVIDAAVPEAMVIHGKQGKFMSLSNQEVNFSSYQALAVGPGMRTNYDTTEFMARLLKECKIPMVLDADALNSFALLDREHRETEAPLWLTPHPGEMARLLGWSAQQVQANRVETVKASAKRFAAQTLLKGPRSRMSDVEGKGWINLNGNAGMATGGSGDVLTGLLGSLTAQGVERERVLALAVYIHGRAGDLAAHRKGVTGMVAGDIVDAIPAVIRDLQGR
ncbi:NAD(P)H-hydrate dehydratase [Kiritimatiellaeota bacterium B1221]|nr:NAD(P)H-hydrate dehydratase [Kiritimatiellaeota bacterium B1221]